MNKRLLIILLLGLFLLTSCAYKEDNTKTETVSQDYGGAVEYAEKEVRKVFAEYEEFQIISTATMIYSDDEKRMIIQFNYTSLSGEGQYGFDIQKSEDGKFETIKQGENIDIYSVLDDYISD